MKIRSTLAAVAVLACGAGSALAQSQNPSGGLYGELSYVAVKVKDSGYSLSPKVLRAIIGTEVNPNLAVEAALGTGLSDGSTQVYGVKVTGEVDRMFGLFLRPKVNLSPDLELFGRVGMVRTKVSLSLLGRSASDSDTDIAYGVGLAYRLGKNASVVVDYMNYYNEDGTKATGLAFGARYQF